MILEILVQYLMVSQIIRAMFYELRGIFLTPIRMRKMRAMSK